MNTMTKLWALGFYLLLADTCQAAGDPFYYSTWYAGSSPGTSWSSASVMQNHPYQTTYSFSGPLYPSSPKYFQPGYGYVVPTWPFRSTMRYYNQNYSFGALSYGSPYDSAIGPNASGGFGSVFGTTGSGLTGGLTTVGTLHSPWYFPGSPGNDSEFLYAW